MFFKISVLFTSFSLFLCACGGENQPRDRRVEVELKGDTSSCLKKVGAQISDYMESKLSESEVTALWSCMDGALDDFVSITAPEHPAGYPPDALARFFEDFFVKREIPLPLARALMNLKRILVGGEKEFLTTEEIKVLRRFIVKGRDWSLNLRPHMAALFLKDARGTDYQRLDQALAVFRQVSFEFGLWLESQNQTLSQTEVRELLSSLNSWLAPPSRVEVMDELLESLPVLFEVKAILIGGTSENMRPGEWALFMRKSVALFQALEIFGLKWKSGDLAGLAKDRSLSGVLFSLEEIFLGVNAPYARVREILSQAEKLSWWPKSLSAIGVGDGLQFFFQRFLQIDPRRQNLTVDHRVSEKLRAMRLGFNDALDGNSEDFSELENRLAAVSASEEGFIFHERDSNLSPSLKRNQLASIHLLLSPLMASYGVESFDRLQFQNAFDEVLGVLQNMGILTSVEQTYGARLFREINVFTLVSDGDSVISKPEIALYAWMALSGFSQQEWLTARMPEACADNDCRLRYLKENYEIGLQNYPRLARSFGALSGEDRDLFFEQMRIACGSDSLVMNYVILSYVEFFMMRFDLNQDEILVLDEVLKSYGIFGATLEELLGGVGVSPEDSLGFFTYLFRYGYTPFDGTRFGAWVRYLNWRLYPEKWSAEADRMRLLQILSELGKL